MAKQMNFLVDTNVWLERLLNQEKSNEVDKFLNTIPSDFLSISDFSLHSIGVILFRLNKLDVYHRFIDDLFYNGMVSCIQSEPIDNITVIEITKSNKLDYDDAYQVMISKKFKLQIVTFDKDFKKNGIIALNPKDAIDLFIQSQNLT